MCVNVSSLNQDPHEIFNQVIANTNLNAMPKDLIDLIFHSLNIKNLIQLSCTNKRFYHLVQTSHIWKALANQLVPEAVVSSLREIPFETQLQVNYKKCLQENLWRLTPDELLTLNMLEQFIGFRAAVGFSADYRKAYHLIANNRPYDFSATNAPWKLANSSNEIDAFLFLKHCLQPQSIASDLLLLYDKSSNSNFEYVETIDGMIVKKKVLGKEIADRLRSLLEHTNLKISAFM